MVKLCSEQLVSFNRKLVNDPIYNLIHHILEGDILRRSWQHPVIVDNTFRGWIITGRKHETDPSVRNLLENFGVEDADLAHPLARSDSVPNHRYIGAAEEIHDLDLWVWTKDSRSSLLPGRVDKPHTSYLKPRVEVILENLTD